MITLGFPILSVLIFLPALGGLLILLAGPARERLVRAIALVVSLVELGLAASLLLALPSGSAAPQLVERAPWIPPLGAEYHLGVDGISALLIGLTALLTVLAVGASWRVMEGRASAFAGSLLFLSTGVVGAFAARDLLLFFVFWEVMLIPMYLLVGTCGGPRRVYAALKFFLYTTAGSLLMLVGLLSLYLYHQAQTGVYTFDLTALATTRLPVDVQVWLFLAFALAFAIKVPIFPLHTWIGDLYTQAPTAALVLATMMVKVGAYGFLRFNLPLFPDASVLLAPILSALAVVGILYGGVVAWAQRDLVRLMAYSSVAHLGFVVLGIFALNGTGASGAVLQMINHGISAGAIFVIAAMIYTRTRTTDLDSLGGLAKRWPVLAGFFLVAVFSSAGLPGLNGFVGEFLILLGAFRAQPAFGVLGALGVVISAIYLLSLYRRAMHERPSDGLDSRSGDVTRREALVLVPMVALIVILGLYPSPVLRLIEGPVEAQLSGTARSRAFDAPEAAQETLVPNGRESSRAPGGPDVSRWTAEAKESSRAPIVESPGIASLEASTVEASSVRVAR